MKKPQIIEEVPDLNQTLLWQVLRFLKDHDENELDLRELYFYPEHLDNLPLIPKGRVVRVTIDLMSQAKLENRPE